MKTELKLSKFEDGVYLKMQGSEKDLVASVVLAMLKRKPFKNFILRCVDSYTLAKEVFNNDRD